MGGRRHYRAVSGSSGPMFEYLGYSPKQGQLVIDPSWKNIEVQERPDLERVLWRFCQDLPEAFMKRGSNLLQFLLVTFCLPVCRYISFYLFQGAMSDILPPTPCIFDSLLGCIKRKFMSL